MKDVDNKILAELLKNARLSDRQLAKKIGISQPTVTRRRAILENELIDGYTLIPKWTKLGYEILAITLIKIKQGIASKESAESIRAKSIKWLMSHPNIIMSGACRGDVDAFMITLHKSFKDYDEFMQDHRQKMGQYVTDVNSVLINLAGKDLLKPLHIKYLAENL
jgi:DNA-binding Lrp family transcriptional regulator